MEIAQTWITEAYRPATQRHHSYIIRLYSGLAYKLGLNPLRPNEELAISFLTFLACNFKTQKSVKSMMATLIACLKRAGVDTRWFTSTNTSLVGRSVSINKRAPTTQRPPVDIHILQRIFTYWRRYEQHGYMMAAAALLMFTMSVRQSNIFPTSQRMFDPSHDSSHMGMSHGGTTTSRSI